MTLLQSQPITVPSSVINTVAGVFGTLLTAIILGVVKLFTNWIKHRKDFTELQKSVREDEEVVMNFMDNYQDDKKELQVVLLNFQKDLHKHALESQKQILELKSEFKGSMGSIDGKLEMLLKQKK